ncbi:unnamed protein product [Citrullus colocynthis]|uniref:Uncharacterized protein n=1 Tax=Citrullus colocynthis TaxID=252529 RepID=A0ABP0ZAR6_9ROSI
MIVDGKAEIDKKAKIAEIDKKAEIEAKLKLFFNPKSSEEEAKLKNKASRIDNLKPQMKSCHDTYMKECMGKGKSNTLCIDDCGGYCFKKFTDVFKV